MFVYNETTINILTVGDKGAPLSDSIALGALDPQGTPHISIIHVMKYCIDKMGNCLHVPAESLIQESPEFYEEIVYSGRFRPKLFKRDIDAFPWRVSTDLVIQGTARCQSPAPSFEVEVLCTGASVRMQQKILVLGNRWVETLGGKVIFSAPETITEMPLRYDKAYGGTDEVAEAMVVSMAERELLRKALRGEDEQMSRFSYPRNPAGKGYLVHSAGLMGHELPNLEFSANRLTPENLILPIDYWGQRPSPACFDWVPYAWFPRFAFFAGMSATYNGKAPELEVSLGIIPENFQEIPFLDRPAHGFAQGAHPLMSHQRLLGNEVIALSHMGPEGDGLTVRLPGNTPVIDMTIFGQFRGQQAAVLDAVFIDAEAQTANLTWRSSFPVPDLNPRPDWESECSWQIGYKKE